MLNDAREYKIKSQTMLACSIERLPSQSNILLLIRRSVYTLTLWDTNDQSFSQLDNFKLAERKWTEDKSTLCTFWSLVKKLVSYFASIKGIWQKILIMKIYTADDNTLFVTESWEENNDQFSEHFWYSYRPDSAGNGVLRLSDLKIFWVGGGGCGWVGIPPDPPKGSSPSALAKVYRTIKSCPTSV